MKYGWSEGLRAIRTTYVYLSSLTGALNVDVDQSNCCAIGLETVFIVGFTTEVSGVFTPASSRSTTWTLVGIRIPVADVADAMFDGALIGL